MKGGQKQTELRGIDAVDRIVCIGAAAERPEGLAFESVVGQRSRASA